jgi:iron complex outermembrane receptor protein
MKKTFVLCSCMLAAAVALAENPSEVDSLKLKELQEVQVVSTRASKKVPMAFTNLELKEIKDINFGKDLPFLLSLTPSALTSSDAGTGIGYTSLRVRGTDGTRINVTANGIPINDAESNGVYWVNMPDFASGLNSIQVQRGVGTSTNGSGAFGASVNMQTENIADKPYVSFDGSAGSYGSHKETLRFGSGILSDHWGFSGRLSNIGSDGYIRRASARLNSYFLQGGYFGETTVVKFITFNGTEKTYHAWDYATKEEMQEYGRRYNPCGKYKDADGHTAFYKDQTDNYHQQHYQLLWNQILSKQLNFNVALHYTHGYGYYEQYKRNQELTNYLLQAVPTDSVNDLIRCKVMRNDFYGSVFAVNYKQNNLQATFGGGWNKYDGDHFGNVIWVRGYNGPLNPNAEYYSNKAHKQDFNVYAKLNDEILQGLNAYVDLQYRYVDYTMNGPSDAFYKNGEQVSYDLATHFNFLNPKAGLFWTINPHHALYGSYGMAHKEPTRNDYEDNLTNLPKAERLNDFELGYKFTSATFAAGVNFYYMLYKDQFVLTGKQNAIGEMIASNVGDSYRRGVELTASWKPFDFLQWDGNATWSHNRSKNLKFYLDDAGELFNVKSAPLSFSPDITVSSVIKGEYKGFTAGLQSQFVGEQYMTTTGLRSYQEDGKNVSLMLDHFFVSNLDLSYTFRRLKFVKSLTLGCTVYNIFDEKYESFGAAYTATKSDGKGGMMGYQDADWNSYSVYSAQAPTHVMFHLSVDF